MTSKVEQVKATLMMSRGCSSFFSMFIRHSLGKSINESVPSSSFCWKKKLNFTVLIYWMHGKLIIMKSSFGILWNYGSRKFISLQFFLKIFSIWNIRIDYITKLSDSNMLCNDGVIPVYTESLTCGRDSCWPGLGFFASWPCFQSSPAPCPSGNHAHLSESSSAREQRVPLI